MPSVVSVNVGRPQTIARGTDGEVVSSAIVKAPVEGRVRVVDNNISGDAQADLTVHGGPDKAVYAYAAEDTAWWSARVGRRLGPAVFGENLTLEGVDVSGAVIGEHWRIGSVELEVCQPRLPCFKLGLRFNDPLMVKKFALAGRPGAYLRIVTEGELGAGDEVTVLGRPEHGVTIALVSHATLLDPALIDHVLTAPQLAEQIAAPLRRRASNRAA
jgi:MOSC domain-containing protein YiiM